MQFKTVMTGCLTLSVAALLLMRTAHADGTGIMAMPTASAAISATAAAEAPKKANQITISNFTFSPATLTVSAGTTATWVNSDDTIHRVMITDLKAKSDALDTDQSFSYKFDKPGTYKYFCTMHPMMTGVVVVK